MRYPSLLPRYNLRFSKGRTFIYDLRLDTACGLEASEAAIVNMMDGSATIDEIYAKADSLMSGASVPGRERMRSFIDRHLEKFAFSDLPMPPAKHMESLERQMKYRSKEWRFSKLREESPFSMTLNLTFACNYKCLFCYQGEARATGKTVPADIWNAFIRQCADMGVQVLTITGGEPVLHSGFFDILDEAKRCGIYRRVLTNGSMWDNESIERLANNGTDYVHFSLPAATPDIYDAVTKSRGHMDRAVYTLREMKRRDIYIKVKMVLTPLNLCDVDSVVDLCADCGVDEVFLAPYILTCKEGKPNLTTAKDISMVAEKAERLQSKHGNSIRINYDKSDMMRWKNPGEIAKCGTVKDNLAVLPDGSIGFCEPLMETGRFIFGNIAVDKLEDIWYSDKLDEADRPINVKEPCRSCEHFSFCKTGCLLFSLIDSGELWGVDPRCFMSKSNLLGRIDG